MSDLTPQQINDGGPAFPQQVWINQNNEVCTAGQYYGEAVGMTLRDYFAGQALMGFTSRHGAFAIPNMAEDAYVAADAMLKARAAK